MSAAIVITDAQRICADIRRIATGRVEWRVQHPVEKSYCISFSRDKHINPEREARGWLDDHQRRFPDSRHASYEVAEVCVYSELECIALEAADALAADALSTNADALLQHALNECEELLAVSARQARDGDHFEIGREAGHMEAIAVIRAALASGGAVAPQALAPADVTAVLHLVRSYGDAREDGDRDRAAGWIRQIQSTLVAPAGVSITGLAEGGAA